MTPVRIPVGFSGLCLLLWGWLSGQLPIAIALAGMFELRYATDRRLAMDPRSLVLAMDLCLLCVAGAIVYLFFTPRTESMGKLLLHWAPMLLLPLAVVHAWSDAGVVHLSQLFHSLTKKRAARPPRGPRLDLTLAYAIICLVAAGGANADPQLFFAGMSLCLVWFLWSNRPKRHHFVLWALMVAAALGTGYVGQEGLVAIQERARNWQRRWLQDPYQSQTGIGDVEGVKLSQQIVLRVDVPEDRQGKPFLLLEAAYDFYSHAKWQATKTSFARLSPMPGATGTPPASYRLLGTEGSPPPVAERVRIFQYFRRAQGLLTLPLSARWVEEVPAERITGNTMGAVLVENVPGMLGYAAVSPLENAAAPATMRMRPPTIVDSLVPPGHVDIVDTAMAPLQLDGLPPREQLLRLLHYFHTTFTYNLSPEQKNPDMRPLEEFLLARKSGHCEYFASAATLMARRLGIPARYATGFSVQEWDAPSGMFVVRESHAHAWTLFWLDGRWHEMDPTPPDWLGLEAVNIPPWQGVADSLSALFFRFSKWRWISQDTSVRQGLLVVAILLAGFLIYRLYKRGGLQKKSRPEAAQAPTKQAGVDSPFYAIIKAVEAETGPRPMAEPLTAWLRRLGHGAAIPLAHLHYRHRFDPQGLDANSRQLLQEGVAGWLAAQQNNREAS